MLEKKNRREINWLLEIAETLERVLNDNFSILWQKFYGKIFHNYGKKSIKSHFAIKLSSQNLILQ